MSDTPDPGLWHVLMPWTSPDAVNRWVARTAWWNWSQPLKTPQQMMNELLEAIAGRFLGRELTLDVRGRHVTFTLGQVRVESDSRSNAFNPFLWWTEVPGAREMMRWTRTLAGQRAGSGVPEPTVERVRVDASGLSIDDHVVGDVGADVDGVRFELGTTTELVTGPVALHVRATRAVALEWVRGAVPGWELHLRAGDLVAARHPRWPVTLLTRPELVDVRSLRVDVVAVELAGRVVRLPKRMVRRRTVELPSPSSELELTAVELDGDAVRVRLRHPGVRQPVRPEHLRAAIREGMNEFGAAVFGPL